uniref:Uncharacterized protein n=1 Tax=Timema genevievae TaxID=629358 RepID=A0A7R9JRG4_TIMGE|nr:unnamed protein product [Timema genevievae]
MSRDITGTRSRMFLATVSTVCDRQTKKHYNYSDHLQTLQVHKYRWRSHSRKGSANTCWLVSALLVEEQDSKSLDNQQTCVVFSTNTRPQVPRQPADICRVLDQYKTSSPQTTSRHMSCSRPIQDLKSSDNQQTYVVFSTNTGPQVSRQPADICRVIDQYKTSSPQTDRQTDRQTDMCQATGLEDTEGIPGQVEWSCTHIHIDVLLGELADMFLQGVPRIPVEPSPHLGCHVRQQEGLVHMALVQPVVSRRRKMASVEPTALVVRVVRPENTDGRGLFDTYTKDDMEDTIKSEPDNYKYLPVKTEHLFDGFSTISEKIKVETDTQEDVVIVIKSEQDNYKSCHVKLERLSDNFIIMRTKLKKHQGNLNFGCLPVQAKGGSRPKCWKYGGTRAWKKCKEEGCSKKAKGGALALVSIHITEDSPAVETIRRSLRLPAFLPSGARFAFLKMGTTPSGGGCGERGGENSSNSQDKLTMKSMLPPPQVALLVEM